MEIVAVMNILQVSFMVPSRGSSFEKFAITNII